MAKQYQHGESGEIPLGFVALYQNPSGILQAGQVDNAGNLKTSVTGAGSGGTSSVDEDPFTAGTSAGTPAMGEDTATGELVILSCTNRVLNSNVTVTPVQSNTSSAPTQTTVGASASTPLAANAARKRLKIQNTGTTTIYLSFGGTNPTVTAYHIALPACGSANDGSSQLYIDSVWTGAVRAISSAAGGTIVIEEDT